MSEQLYASRAFPDGRVPANAEEAAEGWWRFYDSVSKLNHHRAAEIYRLRDAMKDACNLLTERTYGSRARSPGHNARVRLEIALAPNRSLDKPTKTYAHMCRDEHQQIGHNDSSSELCPMCWTVYALEAVDELWSKDALNFAEEMQIGTPVGKVWEQVRNALKQARGNYCDDRV